MGIKGGINFGRNGIRKRIAIFCRINISLYEVECCSGVHGKVGLELYEVIIG